MTEIRQGELDRVAESAAEEWDYRYVESQQFPNRDPMATAIPCQLRFTETPQQNTERFHNALEVHGYSALDSRPTNENSGPYYDGEICSTDHYNRVRVLVFRSDVIRLYPHDDYVPDAEELAFILHALTVGFKSPVEHDPIEKDQQTS